MAFLEVSETGTTGNSITVRAPARTEVFSFSQLEWTVVGLSRHDARRASFGGLVDKLLHMLLGDARDARLANPRLEALRRTALAIRRRGVRLPGEVVEAFHAAGFTRAQFNTLVRSVEFDVVARRQGRLA